MAEARSGGGGALAQKIGLRVGMRGGRRQGSAGIGKSVVAEREEGTGTAAPRRSSQGTPQAMRVVGRDVWRKGSAACLEQ